MSNQKQQKIQIDEASVVKVKSDEQIALERQQRLTENNRKMSIISSADLKKGGEIVADSLRAFEEEGAIEIDEVTFKNHYLRFFVSKDQTDSERAIFKSNWVKGCRGNPTRPVRVVKLSGELIGVMPPIERNLKSEYLTGSEGDLAIDKALSMATAESDSNPIGGAAILNKAVEIKSAELPGAVIGDEAYIEELVKIYEYFEIGDDGSIPGISTATATEPDPVAVAPPVDEWADAYGAAGVAATPDAPAPDATAADEPLDDEDEWWG